MSARRGKSSEWGRRGGWGIVENTAMKLISLACAAIAQLKSSWHVQNTHTTHLHTLKHTHTWCVARNASRDDYVVDDDDDDGDNCVMTAAAYERARQCRQQQQAHMLRVCVCVSVCIEHMLLCALSCHWQAHILFFPSLQLPESVCVQRSHTSHSLRQLGLPT